MSSRSKRPRPQSRDQGLDLFDQYRTDNVHGSVAAGTGNPSNRRAIDLLRDPRTPHPLRLLIGALFGVSIVGALALIVAGAMMLVSS